jgi:hypothetical protein
MFCDADVRIHIEAKQEDRIAIRLETDEVRLDALLTRESSGWKLRYLDHGARREVDLSVRRMPWPTALRFALRYCDERLSARAGTSGRSE